MELKENINIFPPRKFYENVDTKFLNFTPKCRVLPAQYYNDYDIYFELKRRYEPGENKYFPNGGFEVYGPEGSMHNYDLDQVIVHPFHLHMTKFFTTSQSVKDKEKVLDPNKPKGKRGRPSIPEHLRKTPKVYTPNGGKRGRKPLDPNIKAERERIKAEKSKVSNGKRGRPRKIQPSE